MRWLVAINIYRLRALVVVLVAAAMAAGLLALVGTIKPAEAAFPGSNGKIVFTSVRSIDPSDPKSTDSEIFTMNEDGSGLKQLTSNSAEDFKPA